MPIDIRRIDDGCGIKVNTTKSWEETINPRRWSTYHSPEWMTHMKEHITMYVFLCDETLSTDKLHSASTFQLDSRMCKIYRMIDFVQGTWFHRMQNIIPDVWLGSTLKILASLGETQPDVATEFCDGKFTVQKTCRVFSSIAVDKAHEQNNAIIKGDKGAVGLMQSPESLRCWCFAGPEMARMISEFEVPM